MFTTHTAPAPLALASKWGFRLLVLLFALWCVLGFRKDLVAIRLAPLMEAWPAVLMAATLSLLNYALRVVRWRLYLNRMGHTMPWGFSALTFMSGFAFTLSPGKLGEMVRARYYLPRGLALSGITAAFFVERLLDLLAMVLLASVALAELKDYQNVLWVAVALLAVGIAMLALTPWSKLAAYMAAHPHAGSRLHGAAQSLVRMLSGAGQFLSPGLLIAGLCIGLSAWGAEAWGLHLVANALPGIQLSLPSAMGIYAMAIIVGALSFLPGGLGSTEAVMAALLHAQGIALPESILLTLVCRLLTLWLAVLIGWLCVWALRKAPSA